MIHDAAMAQLLLGDDANITAAALKKGMRVMYT